MHTLSVGDAVEYVPDLIHSGRPGPGGFSWAVGRRQAIAKKVGAAPQYGPTTELTDEQYASLLKQSKRSPRLLEGLVYLRPKCLWPAVVDAVNDDGTVDVTVQSPHQAVKYHCDHVKVDESGTVPHTCRPVRS